MDKHDIKLTRKQEQYLDEVIAQVSAGQVLTDKATAEKLGIARQTVSGWHRDPAFRAAARRILRQAASVRDLLVDMSIQRQAMQGNMRAAEMNLRRRGPWDGRQWQDAPQTLAPGGQIINFVGLPKPPTPAEAERRRPPVGSNAIMPAHLPAGITPNDLRRRGRD